MRNVLVALVVVVGCGGLWGCDDNVNYPARAGHVNDRAEVLSKEARAELEVKLAKTQQEKGCDLAIVTVASLEGLSVEAYANRLARKWRIGNDCGGKGILFLIAPTDRKARIEIADEASGIIGASEAGAILTEEVVPRFKEEKIEEGVRVGAQSILDYISGERKHEPTPMWVIVVIIVALIIAVLVVATTDNRRGGGSDAFTVDFGGGFGGCGASASW